MSKIFISYRREDSQYQADRLHAVLKRVVHDPKRNIFIDIDSIPAGADFVGYLDSKVAQCDVMLALIGPGWLSAGEGRPGGRRLQDSRDFVRVEIASALGRGISVAPVLLDGAQMPRADDLPDDLKPLAYRQAVELRRAAFEDDAKRLIKVLNLRRVSSKSPPWQHASGVWRQRVVSLRIGAVVAIALLGMIGVSTWAFLGSVGNPNGLHKEDNLEDSSKIVASTPAAEAPTPTVMHYSAATTPSEPVLPGTVLSTSEAATEPLSMPEASLSKPRTPHLDARSAPSTMRAPIFAGDPTTLPNFAVFRSCAYCPEMVDLPKGSYLMGSPQNEIGRWEDEGPQRKIEIANRFAIGRFEVTVREFRQFVNSTGYMPIASCNAASADADWDHPGFEQAENSPVVCVSRQDILEFIKWLSDLTGRNYRLPTEAEWEYAARAGTSTVYNFGDDVRSACKYENVPDLSVVNQRPAGQIVDCDDGFEFTAPVGTFLPNMFGLYDTLGNVVEMVDDCFESREVATLPQTSKRRTAEPCTFGLARGGSWYGTNRYIRSAYRFRGDPKTRLYALGFRVAVDL